MAKSGYYVILPSAMPSDNRGMTQITCPGCGKFRVIWQEKPTGAQVAYVGGLPNWACLGIYCDMPIPQEKEK